MAFGAYPATSLQTARQKAEEARENITHGLDPAELRKEEKQLNKQKQINADRAKNGLPVLNSFTDITAQWLASTEHLTSTTTHQKKKRRIERFTFFVLGSMPIDKIKSPDICFGLILSFSFYFLYDDIFCGFINPDNADSLLKSCHMIDILR